MNLPERLQGVFQEFAGIKVRETAPRRLRVELPADTLPALLEMLKGRAGFLHLSAISCIDWPEAEEFELAYHVWSYEARQMVSVHVRVPKGQGSYVSVYDIHTPAGFFERDIHEMFGLRFEGSPDMSKFILTDWQGPPPMLKSFSTEGYVHDTYAWRDYRPEWLEEIERKGGGIIEE